MSGANPTEGTQRRNTLDLLKKTEVPVRGFVPADALNRLLRRFDRIALQSWRVGTRGSIGSLDATLKFKTVGENSYALLLLDTASQIHGVTIKQIGKGPSWPEVGIPAVLENSSPRNPLTVSASFPAGGPVYCGPFGFLLAQPFPGRLRLLVEVRKETRVEIYSPYLHRPLPEL